MSVEWWIAFVKETGAVGAVLEFGALIWLNVDRNRLIAENKLKDDRLVSLSERSLTVFAEVKTFLFNERKAPS